MVFCYTGFALWCGRCDAGIDNGETVVGKKALGRWKGGGEGVSCAVGEVDWGEVG